MTRRGTHRHVLLSPEDFRQVIDQERQRATQQLTLFALDDYAGRVVYVDDTLKFTGSPRARARAADTSMSSHGDNARVHNVYGYPGQLGEVSA